MTLKSDAVVLTHLRVRYAYSHELGEDQGEKQYLEKRIDHIPQKPDGRACISIPQVSPRILPDKFTIMPYADDHKNVSRVESRRL